MHHSIAFSFLVFALLQGVTTATPRRFQMPLNDPKYLQGVSSLYYPGPQKVPGDSPAYYAGDPSNDVLAIESLDVIPNPPAGEDDFTILLEGALTVDVGTRPKLKLSSFLNGTVGPSAELDLCGGWRPLKVRQNGKISCPPKQGRVEMSWTKWLPTGWMKTGFYRARAEMYTTNGTKMTDFEGTLWIEGGDGLYN